MDRYTKIMLFIFTSLSLFSIYLSFDKYIIKNDFTIYTSEDSIPTITDLFMLK